MGTVNITRQPRRAAPEIPAGELVVEAPPEIPRSVASRWQQLFQLVPMLTGTVATALLFAGREGGAYSYVVGAIFGVSTLGMLATSWGGGGPRKAEMMSARREYLRHLAGLRRRVRDTAARQRVGGFYRHPDPDQLWSTVDSHRLWERRPADPDFGVVRIAVGPQSLATPLIPPPSRAPEDLEPLTAGALRRFLDAYAVLPDLPISVSVRSFARMYLRVDESEAARGLVRAILAQLATFHAPDDLLIAVCTAPERRHEWDWVKWLPHALHPTKTDAAGPVRLVGGTAVELEQHLDDLLAHRARFNPDGPQGAAPHILVVLDGAEMTASRHLAGAGTTDAGLDAVTLLDLQTPPPRLLDRSMIVLDGTAPTGVLRTSDGEDDASVGVIDTLSRPEAEALARRLAPLRLTTVDTQLMDATGRSTAPDLAELLGVPGLAADPYAFEPVRGWAPRPHRRRLRVPIGVAPDGTAVELDLKESAQDGMGPHGLLIGATGSGKSELLRTLVLALAATHNSETLNFVLIDFKGGATFTSLDRLPHVAAVITNLADELPLVDRATDAINGELVRRQELLRRAGNFTSVRDYERARAGGAPLAPLPSLLLICDEFSELLTAKPELIDLFVQIGRVGRSLGVHLLLASQRLEEGRLRGLDTHLSYRIGLRTFSAMESRTVLGVTDAYELPRSPGHGYLKYGTEPLTRFRAAFVSGPYHRPVVLSTVNGRVGGHRVLDYSTHHTPVPEPAHPPASPPAPPAVAEGDSLLDILTDRLAGQGVPAHQVWLPPLSTPPSLDELLGPVTLDPGRGLSVGNPQLRGALQVPVALVDKPYEQRREALWLQLDSAAGHVAVAGGPQSGKSTALRTLILGLALTHTPAEAQVYCLDFGGGQLGVLRGLPHIGGVSGRLETAAVRRTIGEIATLLADRERRFTATGIDGMAAYRHRRATATAGEDPWGDVFLVVDGWATLRSEYEDLEQVVTDLATRGLSYGIHVVATASRWTDFRPGIRDLFGSRLELRLGDPNDSAVNRRAAGNVPERAPGRGITAGPLHFLTAVPTLSAGPGSGPGSGLNGELRNDPSGTAADLVRAIASGWTGPVAPRVRLLPPVVEYATIATARDEANPLALPIGLAEADLRPVLVDFAAEPHFLLFGDAECGKSSFLRTLATSITERFTAEQARIILVDYRRSLHGAVAGDHLIGYGTAAAHTAELIESVAGYMRARLPGSEVTQEQLRDRSWWTGPHCFVLVDDYDLVATGPSNPLTPLLEYLPQARDIGLHLVLTRRSGGASRALYEPVIQRLRELSSPGLVMSGDREEGPLLGTVRPAALPPGRGRFVTRKGGIRLIQLARLPKVDVDSPE